MGSWQAVVCTCACPLLPDAADYASSTVDLIDALQLDQPDILGWSLGGIIALTVAMDFPDAVSHVVVTDTTSGGPGKGETICAL